VSGWCHLLSALCLSVVAIVTKNGKVSIHFWMLLECVFMSLAMSHDQVEAIAIAVTTRMLELHEKDGIRLSLIFSLINMAAFALIVIGLDRIGVIG
jgi:hypothetical protein